MKMEYFTYYHEDKASGIFHLSKKKMRNVSDIRKQLPEKILCELIPDSDMRKSNCISVETRKISTVEYLDRILQLKKKIFKRVRYIEITEEEIPKYEFYYVDLRSLDWGAHIEYEVTRPICEMEACPYGSKIVSDYKLYVSKIPRLSIGRIWGIWDMSIKFIISRKLKEAFDSEGVTGLNYRSCLVENRSEENGSNIQDDHFYMVQIIPNLTETADNISLAKGYFCKKHSILFRYDGLFNRSIQKENASDDDFQMINRTTIMGKVYYFRIPYFFLSRKILNILLKYNIKDMKQRGPYLKRSFVPVLFSDRMSSDVPLILPEGNRKAQKVY